MVNVTFEVCCATFDDENNIVSGWNDVRLSQHGMDQAKQMEQRYQNKNIDAVFCSDLKRAEQTVSIAFDINPRLVFMDWRLRDCDYGEMNQSPQADFDAAKLQHINVPFAGGESFEQAALRVRSLLVDIKTHFDGKHVILIGHKSTKYALDLLLANKPLDQSVQEAWAWQSGWDYQIQ